MNYETTSEPVPGAEVGGLTSFATERHDRRAMLWCMIGFDVTGKNVATIRPMMIIHLKLVHGCVRRAERRLQQPWSDARVAI